MVTVNNIEFHEDGWDEMLTGIVDSWARPRAEAIADRANQRVAKIAEVVLAQPDTAVEPEGNTPTDKSIAEKRTRRRRANRRAAHFEPPEGKRDYMVSTEGSNPLRQGDYRATVITVTERAKIDNARDNTLIRLMGEGGA